MWIAVGIGAALIAAIVFILLLPLGIIIECGDEYLPQLQFRLFGRTLDSNSDKPDNAVTRFLKKSIGVSKAEETLENDSGSSETTIRNTFRTIQTILTEITELLPRCTMKTYHIHILCTGSDAADTAINYGKCCAAVYPITGLIASKIPTKASGVSVNIQCDYLGNQNKFTYHFHISVQLIWLLVAYIRFTRNEQNRNNTETVQ